MRQVHRKGLAVLMLTGGALAMAGHAHADSNADGGAARSPGLLSGNTVQIPVNVPVNACGNTVDVLGVLNPAAGNACASAPDVPGRPPVRPRPATPPKPAAPVRLADTGSGSVALTAPAGAALLLGGIVLYRRRRPANRS